LSAKILTLPLQKDQAQDILRQVAEDSSRIIFTNHAEDRMYEREITRTDIIRVLRTGSIKEGPSQAAKGNWEMKVEGKSAGTWVTVAIAIDYKELREDSCYTVVITTF
jgi:Tol biopolymer transport system component